MHRLSEHDILVESQHGFRSGRSCEIQLVQFIHDLYENLDGAHNRDHKQTDLIIMDFAKAFDTVPHRRLVYKLEYYGIYPKWYPSVDHCLAVWANTKSRHRWCLLRPCPCVVWFSSGFRARAHSLLDIYQWPARQHKLHSLPFSRWLCPLSKY